MPLENCAKDKDDPGLTVHTYEPDHTCGLSKNVLSCKSNWWTYRFLSKIKIEPDKYINVFILEVSNELSVTITEHQAYRKMRKVVAIREKVIQMLNMELCGFLKSQEIEIQSQLLFVMSTERQMSSGCSMCALDYIKNA